MKRVDLRGVGCLVEAGVFDGGTDDGAAGVGSHSARDDVEVAGADDEGKWEIVGQRDGEHLTFDGADGEGGIAGPGTGAVDEVRGLKGAGWSGDADACGFGGCGENG